MIITIFILKTKDQSLDQKLKFCKINENTFLHLFYHVEQGLYTSNCLTTLGNMSQPVRILVNRNILAISFNQDSMGP